MSIKATSQATDSDQLLEQAEEGFYQVPAYAGAVTNRTVTLPETLWEDIEYILYEGMTDIETFKAQDSDGFTQEDLDKRQRLLNKEAYSALIAELRK